MASPKIDSILWNWLPPLILCTQARAHCRVAVATLNTLAGYIDWVSLVHITTGNCHLLEMLCLLLSEPELQLEAAECLLIAVSRKVRRRRWKEKTHFWKSFEMMVKPSCLLWRDHSFSLIYRLCVSHSYYKISLELPAQLIGIEFLDSFSHEKESYRFRGTAPPCGYCSSRE